MAPVQPSPAGVRKAADADLLGESVPLSPPVPGAAGKAVAPAAAAMPEPPPAEDENQPGFIGERNRPAP